MLLGLEGITKEFSYKVCFGPKKGQKDTEVFIILKGKEIPFFHDHSKVFHAFSMFFLSKN